MSRVIVGPKARFSFANVFAPNIKSGKYEVDVLIHKSDTDTLNALFAAYAEVVQSTVTDSRFKNVPHNHPTFKHTLKDGDVWKANDHTYAGHWYFKAKSAERPEVVGPALEPLSSESQFYSGCFGYVSVDIKAYAPSANYPNLGYGINFKLGNIQKVSDGERLSGGASASSEFQQVGPPSTGAPAAPAPYGAPAAPAQFGAPQQPAPYGAPAAPQSFGQPAPAASPFGAPAPNPFAQPQAPAQPQQYPGVPQQFGAPQPQGFPAQNANPFPQPTGVPQPQGAPAPYGPPAGAVNPAAPQAPWPGAAQPQAQASQPAMPWQQNQYPQ